MIKLDCIRLFADNKLLRLRLNSFKDILNLLIHLIFDIDFTKFSNVIKREGLQKFIFDTNIKMCNYTKSVCKFCWLFWLNQVYKKQRTKSNQMYVICIIL